jgi:hypothetical protein
VRIGLLVLFLLAQALDLAYAWIGARRAGKPRLAPWALTLPFYFPLATLALVRALWEVLVCPFRWDKTAHGFDLPPGEDAITPPPAPLPHRAEAVS